MLVLTNGGSIQLQFRPNHHNYRQTVKYKTQMILIKVIGFFLEIVVYCMDFNNEVISRSYILSGFVRIENQALHIFRKRGLFDSANYLHSLI